MGIIESIALIVSTLGTTVFAANALYLGTYALALGALGYAAVQSMAVQKPAVPKPEDGSYNLKQQIPPLSYVLGRVKKGADYVFLEETNGTAYHVMVWASHRVNQFVQHYLHDKKVSLDTDGGVLTTPFFYRNTKNVRILSRLGTNSEVAYQPITLNFPTIWSAAHRGDGLASVMMLCKTVSQKNYLKVYPNQMPEHSAVAEGALLYDPRKDSSQGGSGPHRYNNPATWEYTSNLALMRLWHLCHPVGGKLSYSTMYLPDWANAASVCDQIVTNRTGGSERRYHGGFWFRANNDPTEVGRIIDEAAEMVVYERSDGRIGVHAGEYVAPDVVLNERAIFSIRVDKNRRISSNVLAVRGRWVNPSNDYNLEDAAMYGDPYGEVDETERTKTFENQAIQSHNHCQRKQKLLFTRTNARKVAIVADYTASNVRLVPYRRFVTVHHPRRDLVNALVEITSSVTIDLRNMRISFSGIVVSSGLYEFDASIEEGKPGEVALPAPEEGVPTPVNFTAEVETEVVSGGATAAFIRGEWDYVDPSLTYELEYERTNGGTGVQSVFSEEEETQVRTGYLADGEQYRVRLRAWGGGTPSEWTGYIVLTATADPVAPGGVTGASVAPGTGQALFQWTAPNSSNYFACRIYIGTANNPSAATLVATEYGPPSAVDLRTITSLAPGTYYGWLRAINPSGREAAAVATGAFTIS